MLYMEDYLEMIEHLPNELRDRFTEMREMDLSVQNRVDSLAGREKTFFSQCRRLKTTEREAEFKKLKTEYSKVIEDSSEKIQSAEECYNFVDRYLRKLDQELHKFKMELEADHRGITEILEKRSLEMDAANTSAAASAAAAAAGTSSLGGLSTSKENRLPKKRTALKPNQTIAHHGLGGPTLAAFSGLESPLPRAKADRKGSTSSALGLMPSPSVSGPSSSGLQMGSFAADMLPLESLASPGLMASSPGHSFPLQHMGAGGNAIAAAASQAIAATQQLVPGRRTSSLKASYEAINLGVQTHEFSIGRELAGAAQSAVAASNLSGLGEYSGPPPSKRQKSNKRVSHAAGSSSSGLGVDPGTPGLLDVVSSGASSLMDDGSGLLDASAGLMGPGDLLGGRGGDNSSQEGSANEAEMFDPSEPRYCICNQVSYGDMVACDNDECPYEWFHYPCVGITATPKGKWFCSTCLARKKKK